MTLLRLVVSLRRLTTEARGIREQLNRIADLMEREAPPVVAGEDPRVKGTVKGQAKSQAKSQAKLVDVHVATTQELNEGWMERHPY
jgi:hypothetical protein